MDLTTFLLARIAEDEAVAKAAASVQGARWSDEGGILSSDTEPNGAPGRGLTLYAPVGRWMLWDCEGAGSLCVADATSAHMAGWDPGRVLADCEAKRRIVELHEITTTKISLPPFDSLTGEPNPHGYEVTCAACGWASLDATSGCATLRLLALLYADHDEYNEEWRP